MQGNPERGSSGRPASRQTADGSPGGELLSLAAAEIRCRRHEKIEVVLAKNRCQHVPIGGEAQVGIVADVVGYGSNLTISIRYFHNSSAGVIGFQAEDRASKPLPSGSHTGLSRTPLGNRK